MRFPTEYTKEEWIIWANAFGKGFAVEYLGIEVIEISDDSLTLRMPINNNVRQPFGVIHGGINLLLAETASGMHAAYKRNLNEEIPVGVEVNGSHVRSVEVGTVLAIATVVRKSRNLAVHTVEIIHEESGKVLSSARVTNFYKKVEKNDTRLV